ncbi:MAG: hypothetical protein R3D44_06515 [Hyphomicrobiaceae bacterium]
MRPAWPRGGFVCAMAICFVTVAPAAMAGSSQMFPVRSHLVPAVVAAAFILPALMAGVASVLKRIGRSPVALVGLCLFAVGAAALVAYVNPTLLTALRV